MSVCSKFTSLLSLGESSDPPVNLLYAGCLESGIGNQTLCNSVKKLGFFYMCRYLQLHICCWGTTSCSLKCHTFPPFYIILVQLASTRNWSMAVTYSTVSAQ